MPVGEQVHPQRTEKEGDVDPVEDDQQPNRIGILVIWRRTPFHDLPIASRKNEKHDFPPAEIRRRRFVGIMIIVRWQNLWDVHIRSPLFAAILARRFDRVILFSMIARLTLFLLDYEFEQNLAPGAQHAAKPKHRQPRPSGQMVN
jgi:hypothetical protein